MLWARVWTALTLLWKWSAECLCPLASECVQLLSLGPWACSQNAFQLHKVICAHVFQRSWGYKGKGRVYILSSSCKCLGVLYMSALGPVSGQDRPAAEQTRNGLADWVRGEEG